MVVEDDLAFDLFASQGFEFVEVVHLHDIAADPFFRCRDGATECADRNFLRIACTRDDASAFLAPRTQCGTHTSCNQTVSAPASSMAFRVYSTACCASGDPLSRPPISFDNTRSQS